MNITLRDVKLSDANFLYSLYTSRNPEDVLSTIKYEDQKKFVQNFLESDETHPYINWNIIEKDDKPIGSVTIHKKNNELGFWLIPEFQGKGIGPKAVKKFMEMCKMDYYTALVRPDNYPSVSLVKKLGFELTHHKYTLKNTGI